MPRIFLALEESPGTIRITGEKAHYLAAVLRVRSGDDLEILNGKGLSYRARVLSLTRKAVIAEVLGVVKHDTESPLNLILIQGLLKGEKMELVIQKTTELGIREIIPAVTERSQVRDTRKAARWEKIAEDASRQCGRTIVPRIHEPVPFPDIFSRTGRLTSFEKYKGLLFWEEGGIGIKEIGRMSGDDFRTLIIAVGPEGGFMEKEVHAAESEGFLTASLGKRIVRAETAAITAIALTQFLFGDLA